MYRVGILAGMAWLAGKRTLASFYTGFDNRLHDWDTPLPGTSPCHCDCHNTLTTDQPRSADQPLSLAGALIKLLRH